MLKLYDFLLWCCFALFGNWLPKISILFPCVETFCLSFMFHRIDLNTRVNKWFLFFIGRWSVFIIIYLIYLNKTPIQRNVCPKMSKHLAKLQFIFSLSKPFRMSPRGQTANMLNPHRRIGHMQFANCQPRTKKANVNSVSKSFSTYWAGRTNAPVNCYLQKAAGAVREKCIRCEMSQQSLWPITVNLWLCFTGLELRS